MKNSNSLLLSILAVLVIGFSTQISGMEALAEKHEEAEPLPTSTMPPPLETIDQKKDQNSPSPPIVNTYLNGLEIRIIPSNAEESYDSGIRFYNNQDYSAAKILFEQAAAAKKKQPVAYEFPHALYMLGVMNLLGQGADKNVGKAIFYFKEYGNTIQRCVYPRYKRCEHPRYIGGEILYDEGMKLYDDKDYKGAIVLFDQAVTEDYHDALYMLGIMYFLRQGVSNKEGTGLYFLSAFARFGNQDVNSKKLYDEGIKHYISKDYLEAHHLFAIAAEYKNADALFMRGLYYHYSFAGVPPCYDRAIKYYTAAAEGGHALAKDNLEAIENIQSYHSTYIFTPYFS